MLHNLTRIPVFDWHKPVIPLQRANISISEVSCSMIPNLLKHIFSGSDAPHSDNLMVLNKKCTKLSPLQ